MSGTEAGGARDAGRGGKTPSPAAPDASTPCDAIVVGSGFGGAVTACRLAQAGLVVDLFERGRRYALSDFPAMPRAGELWPEASTWRCQPGLSNQTSSVNPLASAIKSGRPS